MWKGKSPIQKIGLHFPRKVYVELYWPTQQREGVFEEQKECIL